MKRHFDRNIIPDYRLGRTILLGRSNTPSQRTLPHGWSGVALRSLLFPTICLVLLLLASCTYLLQAQDDTLRMRYGVLGGFSFNVHRADFRALPGVPNCCPEFASGTGGGPVAGALVEFPLASDLLLALRASYVSHNARLLAREQVRVIVNGTGTDGAFEHSVDATISSIGLEPSLRIRPAGNLFLGIGARAGMLLGKSYAQEERIVEPAGVGTFLDADGNDSRSRVRNANEGTLPNAASMLAQAVLGVGYELPLNRRGTLLLEPEASYAFSLTDVVEGIAWKPDGVRLVLALKYSPAPKPMRYDTVVVRDTTTRETTTVTAERITLVSRTPNVEETELPDVRVVSTTIREQYLRELPAPPPMRCSLTASGVNDDGVQEPMATLRVEEFLSTVAHPLLNYVFFEPGSDRIPSRYNLLDAGAREGFRSSNLRGTETLPVYYTMLNIIGERMRAYPAAVLTLTGCNMDHDAEKGNIELSRHRAEAVREYLATIWGIDRARLRVEATNLPARRSNPLTPDGQGENRRVEIESSVPEILDVLLINDTTRTSSPPVVRFTPVIESPRGTATWQLTVVQRGTVLKQFNGTGSVPAQLDWDIANDQAHMPRFNEPLEVTLNVSNTAGERVSCSLSLPTQVITVQQKRENRAGDYTIDRYNLILFSVGAAVISPANQRIIDLVKSRLAPGSAVVAEGFADRSGNPASNQELSARRAKATVQALGRPDAVTRGIGESRLLYSNETPEGRYYCRTVQITVKTPVGR